MEYFYTFAENWRTFFYDWGYIRDVGGRVGGPAELLSDFLLQFSVTPLTGTLVMAMELGLLVWLLDKLTTKICGSHILLPFALIPASALVILHSNINCSQSGTVALILMLATANIQLGIKHNGRRLCFSATSSAALLLLCGPVASLYSILLLTVELFKSPRQGLPYLLPAALTGLLGQCCVWLGWTPDLLHTLLPYGYFNPMLKGGSILLLPWILILSDVILACLPGIFKPAARWLRLTLAAVQLAAAVWFACVKVPGYIDKNNTFLMKLSCQVAHEDWDAVLNTCSHTPMTNLVHQNYLNLALAEKGMLGDYLFTYPSYDIQSIYLKETRNPWLYPVLSDVYFSMGHMSLSQRYAFEALQSFGNRSPRLLKRLVQTNEVLGYDETAAKYRRLLSKTLFYRKWAREYTLPEEVRRCIIPNNNFSGEYGLDKDLAQLVESNPAHSQTIQYLGSLCLLLRDLDRFQRLMETFYGTEAMPEKLPVAFQEGVVAFARGDTGTLERYNIDSEVIDRFETYKSNHSKERDSFWYFINDKI